MRGSRPDAGGLRSFCAHRGRSQCPPSPGTEHWAAQAQHSAHGSVAGAGAEQASLTVPSSWLRVQSPLGHRAAPAPAPHVFHLPDPSHEGLLRAPGRQSIVMWSSVRPTPRLARAEVGRNYSVTAGLTAALLGPGGGVTLGKAAGVIGPSAGKRARETACGELQTAARLWAIRPWSGWGAGSRQIRGCLEPCLGSCPHHPFPKGTIRSRHQPCPARLPLWSSRSLGLGRSALGARLRPSPTLMEASVSRSAEWGPQTNLLGLLG